MSKQIETVSDLKSPIQENNDQDTKSYCTKCEAILQGFYCSNCGQAAKNRRGPIWQMSAEFAHEVFSIDSKVLRGLWTLLLKPGVLTVEFISGKRMSVLPPVRLYLVVSLLFFFVFEIPTPDVREDNVYIGKVLLGHEKPTEDGSKYNIIGTGSERTIMDDWFESTFEDQIKLMKEKNPQVTVDRIFSHLENVLPNILILFLPLFALVMKLLYFFKRVLYFDHLIFSLHFQTWLMGAILIIYGLALHNPWWSALSLFVPVYLAKAQKVAYAQSYWLVIPKTLLIITIYIALLSVGAMVSLLSAIALLK